MVGTIQMGGGRPPPNWLGVVLTRVSTMIGHHARGRADGGDDSRIGSAHAESTAREPGERRSSKTSTSLQAKALTAEFALTLTCAIRPVAIERVRHAARTVTDWDLVHRIARRQGVVGLVADAMRRADVPIPQPLERNARRRGRAALRQAGEAVRLDGLFAAAGIDPLFLKGTSLARHLYGALGIRDAVDIDIMVSPHRVADAWAVLDAAGYSMKIPARRLAGAALRMFLCVAKDSCHRHPAGMIVELHWRLSDDLANPSAPPPETWRRIAVAPGQSLAMLDDEALFVYLCVHGAAHGWARLKWLADIGAMVASSEDGGDAYWRASRRAGASLAAASALLLAHRFLGTSLPATFVAARSLRLGALLWMSVRTMTAGGGARDLSTTRYRGWVEFAAKLLIAPSFRSLAVTLRRLAISSEDVGQLALPGGCGWMYPVLRIPLLVRRRLRRVADRRRAGMSA